MQVLYLVFNEGYTTSSAQLCSERISPLEAIRLTRMLRQLIPEEGEVAGFWP